MHINLINTTNFGMKYSKRFDNFFANYPYNQSYMFPAELAKAKEEMKTVLDDTYTMDIGTSKLGGKAVILCSAKKMPQILYHFANGQSLDGKFLDDLRSSLDSAKKYEKYLPDKKNK